MSDDSGQAPGAAYERLVHELGERVKELTTIHQVALILNDPMYTLDAALLAVAGLIPSGYQWPAHAVARIHLGERAWAGAGWRTGPIAQVAELSVDGQAGAIEVVYHDPPVAAGAEPFLPEEASLLRSLAELVGSRLARAHANEELRFRARLLDAVEQAVIATRLDGTVIAWNRYAEVLYGWTADEALGRPLLELVPAPDTKEQAAAIMADLANGSSWTGEFLVRRRDGTTFPAFVTDSPIHDAQGRLVGIVGISTDISERARIEAALRASEARFQAQYRGFPLPTYTWRRDGDDLRLIDYNDAALVASLGSIATVLGRTPSELFPDDPDFVEDLARCAAEQTAIRVERRFRYPGADSESQLLVTYVPVPPDLVMVHTEDVTEQQRLASQLLQAQKLESVGRLAGGLAHDFNNILTAVAGYADLAAMAIEPDHPAQADLAEIRAVAERSGGITRQLLTLARRQTLAPQYFRVGDAIREVDKLLARLLGDESDVTLDLEDDRDWVEADRGQIEQVLINLAVNARDAMPDGGAFRVTVRSVTLDTGAAQSLALEAGDYIMLAASDTGVGISADIQAHIFEPFFTTKPPDKGTGLGLATAYSILRQHGGAIAVESAPGQGATFTLYLPRGGPPPAFARTAAQPAGLPRGAETILLVEDNPSVRDLTRRVLEAQGYTVLVAADGQAALDLLAGARIQAIDLLITDMAMPRLGGLALAEHILGQRPGTRVLFMSGNLAEAVGDDRRLPADTAFLPKPFAPGALTRKVRDVLDG